LVQKDQRRALDRTPAFQQRSCFRGAQDRVSSSRKCAYSRFLGRWGIQRPARFSDKRGVGRSRDCVPNHSSYGGCGAGNYFFCACGAASSAGGKSCAARRGCRAWSCTRNTRSYRVRKAGATDSRGRIQTEVSYRNGSVVPRGTRGSVRVDAVRGRPERPKEIWDLKTGGARLTPQRIQQIRRHLPRGCQNIPIREVRPR